MPFRVRRKYTLLVGCGRLRPCEKSNMFDISHDHNRFISPAHKQNVQSQASLGLLRPKFTESCVVPGRLRPLVPDLHSLVPGGRLLIPDSNMMLMNFMREKVGRLH